MRTSTELQSNDPAWPLVQTWVTTSPRTAVVLPESGAAALLALQVTTRSVLGSLAFECGGMVLDHGWLRVLGGGHQELPALSNGPGHVVVAHDVIGGLYVINGGSVPDVEIGHVGYFAPDTLQWLDLGFGHGDFVEWCLTGDLDAYYEDLRWPGWQQEAETLTLSQGISVYPFLFSAEAQRDLAATTRRPVPIAEIFALHVEMARQLGDHDGPVEIRIEP